MIVTRFDREPVPGFVQTPGGFAADSVELLTPSGTVVRVPYSEVKAVCFVRDFEDGDGWRQDRTYAARPKTAGLWVRLRFQDGDTSEGVIPNNLMLLEPEGFQIILPDPSFMGQRLFVPREALAGADRAGGDREPLEAQAAGEGGAGADGSARIVLTLADVTVTVRWTNGGFHGVCTVILR